jgi:hypothetical protein
VVEKAREKIEKDQEVSFLIKGRAHCGDERPKKIRSLLPGLWSREVLIESF